MNVETEICCLLFQSNPYYNNRHGLEIIIVLIPFMDLPDNEQLSSCLVIRLSIRPVPQISELVSLGGCLVVQVVQAPMVERSNGVYHSIILTVRLSLGHILRVFASGAD